MNGSRRKIYLWSVMSIMLSYLTMPERFSVTDVQKFTIEVGKIPLGKDITIQVMKQKTMLHPITVGRYLNLLNCLKLEKFDGIKYYIRTQDANEELCTPCVLFDACEMAKPIRKKLKK
jgi:hypothetical protein